MDSIVKLLFIIAGGIVASIASAYFYFQQLEAQTSDLIEEVRETRFLHPDPFPATQGFVTDASSAILDSIESEDYDAALLSLCLLVQSAGTIHEVSGDQKSVTYILSIKEKQKNVIERIENKLGKKCLTSALRNGLSGQDAHKQHVP